jgi:multiple sugar transport system substrate-binding protein
MYYRADWFKEAGLEPPKTFDEFQTAAIKLTDPSKNRFGFGMRGAGGGEGMVIEVMRSFGSPIVDDKGQPAMDRAKATDALRWFTELYTKHKVVPASVTNDSFQQIMTGFTTGQTAMLWHHTGSLIDVSTALGADSGKFGTLPRPAGPVAHIADVSYSYNAMADPKNEDIAWAWLDFWAQPDSQISFLESTGYFPSSTKVVEDPRVQKNPYYGAAIETLKFGGPAPAFAGSSNWGTTVLLPAFQRVLLAEIKPEEAVDLMMKGLDKAVKG